MSKDWVKELENIMARLRAKDGCPWDQEQTHETLKPYLIEEAYEFIDAIDDGDPKEMASELGDILLQVVFHSQIAKEEGSFDLQEVAQTCCEMLVRRHPHVFGEGNLETAEEVTAQWEEIKKQEATGQKRKSALDGVPKGLPSLAYAEKLQKKAAKVGFDWEELRGPVAKIHEEVGELQEAIDSGDLDHARTEAADLLFATVNTIRFLGGDAETLLRQGCHKFVQRFQGMEKTAAERERALKEMNIDELEQLWVEAKSRLGGE